MNAQSGDLAGTITKHFQITELITDANAFGLDYDPKMPPEMKALLMAAVLNIDFSFFEGSSNEQMKETMGIDQGNDEKKRGRMGCNITGCCCLGVWLFLIIMFGGFIAGCIYGSTKFGSKKDKDSSFGSSHNW